jgi:elongation factor Ts
MDISAKDVMALRQKTGVSMMMCKEALVEAEGDMDKAVDILKKKGEAKAAKKSDRDTGEGRVAAKSGEGKVSLVSVRCETDFVARNDDFVALVDSIADKVLSDGESAQEAAEQMVQDAVSTMGENLQLGDVKLAEGDVIGSYVHSNGKIGVMIVLDGGDEPIDDAQGLREKARDVAMHAAAMAPAYVSPDEVSDEDVAREKEIWAEQLKNEGKPENIIENIMAGKEKKFREESALLTQAFVKDPGMTVGEYLGDAKVTGYFRIQV